MTHPNREIPRPTCHGEEEPAVLSAAHWREQAALAEEYAHARPASDMAGFFSAMRDAERFRAMAHSAPVDGEIWWQSLSPAEKAAAIRRAE